MLALTFPVTMNYGKEKSKGMGQLSEEGGMKESDGGGGGGAENKNGELEGNEGTQSDHKRERRRRNPLSDTGNAKRREREKSRRRSDSDHQRAERLTFFCLSIRGLISLWLGSRVPETGGIKVELRGIIRGSGTILQSLPIQTLAIQRHYTTYTTWRVFKRTSHKHSCCAS